MEYEKHWRGEMGDLGVSVMGKGWYDGRNWGSWKAPVVMKHSWE